MGCRAVVECSGRAVVLVELESLLVHSPDRFPCRGGMFRTRSGVGGARESIGAQSRWVCRAVVECSGRAVVVELQSARVLAEQDERFQVHTRNRSKLLTPPSRLVCAPSDMPCHPAPCLLGGRPAHQAFLVVWDRW